jgi:hypothetical protein
MKKNYLILVSITILLGCLCNCNRNVVKNDLKAPAYPLISIDPYTSGWSFTDNLYDGTVKHWTGKSFPLIGALKVDGKSFRFMGLEEPEFNTVAKTSEEGEWLGKYTTTTPSAGWMCKDFNDTQWKSGPAAFGTTNEFTAKTLWDSDYIWVRREVKLDESLKGKNVYLEYSHDDDAIIYINEIEVVNTGDDCKMNVRLKLSEEVVNTLIKGNNLIAGYCYNRRGNGLFDIGLLVEKEEVKRFENAASQKSADVQAMQTHYTFACGNIDLKLTFTAPLFMDDLNLISRPVNYISYEVNSNDNKPHDVEIYFEASPCWALDKPLQESVSESFEEDNLVFLKTGSVSQEVLVKRGDDVRIDWGYFYLAAEKENTSYSIGQNNHLSLTRTLGSTKNAQGKIMVGYDDIYSIQYFGENLRPYWNTNNDQTIVGQFQKANKEYEQLVKKCNQFDEKLMKEATQEGGKKYAELCALAYRQAIAAHKLVKAPNGDLLFLSKENFSNGSIGTVDITYPSSPLFLLYNPELAKGLLNHIFYYSESGKWEKPFPSHDIGTYPLANGQTYGGDMPIEESGNALILTAAIAVVEGNAKYAEKHWEVLTVWTDYLMENGLDPENQLCTDDFAGHFAHNTNLSVKAILGVASYGYLADKLGKKDLAEKYTGKAKEMAAEWEKMANDGDHYRLTFDKPGTWSLKYNLVWDKLLKFGIFSKEIAPKEIAYYLNKQNKYGIPLDNRATYTKADWIIWTATLAEDKETFERFINPLYLFVNETVDRIPMSDWVFTDKPTHIGFQARSVVGGYYIKMLEKKLKIEN